MNAFHMFSPLMIAAFRKNDNSNQKPSNHTGYIWYSEAHIIEDSKKIIIHQHPPDFPLSQAGSEAPLRPKRSAPRVRRSGNARAVSGNGVYGVKLWLCLAMSGYVIGKI